MAIKNTADITIKMANKRLANPISDATKAAIKWANKRLAKPISDATKEEYESVYKRQVANKKVANATNGRTRALQRAAFRYHSALEIVRMAPSDSLAFLAPHRAADYSARIDKRWALIEQVKSVADQAVATYLEACEAGIREQSRKQKKLSKRRGLNRLPTDWLEQLVLASTGSQYGIHIQVMAACGCRPAEMAKGVLVEKLPDGGVAITIYGAKVSSRTKAGQQWRRMVFPPTHPAAAIPADTYTAKPKAIQDAVEHFGKKIGNSAHRISAYSLRNAFATNLKIAKWSAVQVAQALGHASTATQSYYGAHSSKGGRLTPKSVTSAVQPHDNRKIRSFDTLSISKSRKNTVNAATKPLLIFP